MSLFSKPMTYIFRIYVFSQRTNIFLDIRCQSITTTSWDIRLLGSHVL